jgi:hypothetical protein
MLGREGLELRFGAGFGDVVLGALVGVVLGALGGVGALALAGTGVASGLAGGGAETEATSGGLGLAGVETASTIGATAELSCAGLTAEPTIRPNASNAMTAIPVIVGEGTRRAASAPLS